MYLAAFIQKDLEKFCISEPLRGQRSAAGIFEKLDALDISLMMYQLEIFSWIPKKAKQTLVILYKAVIY